VAVAVALVLRAAAAVPASGAPTWSKVHRCSGVAPSFDLAFDDVVVDTSGLTP
jgi:hypothetical protein